MQNVTVYYFTCYNIRTDEKVRSQRPATREAIARCNGVVIEETAQEVAATCLDGDGFVARDKM